MHKNIKQNFIRFLFLTITSTFSLSLVPLITSCNIKKNNEDENFEPELPNENNPIIPEDNEDDDQITEEDLKREIIWLEGFKEQHLKLVKNLEIIKFEMFEIIFENNKYLIKYIGENNLIPSYSIFVKDINKYYSISISTSYEKLFKIYTILKIKDFLTKIIISSFEENMILEHNIEDDNFFIPIDTSDDSIKFEKNNIINFESSWNVENKKSTDLIFNINLTKTKIKNMLFGFIEDNHINYKLKEIKIKQLSLLPRMVLIDSPINSFNFKLNSILNNFNDEEISLTKEEKNKILLELPIGNNIKNWSGKINNNNYEGKIIDYDFENGLSLEIGNYLSPGNKDNFSNIFERTNKEQQKRIKEYVSQINDKSKKINLNHKVNFSNESEEKIFSINTNSTIEAIGKSASLIPDGTTVGIFQISSIMKIDVNFIEYKKF